MIEVQYFTLDSTTAGNKYVDLTSNPIGADSVALDIIGGTAQAMNSDFGVDGTRVKWSDASYSLYSVLTSGDQLRVIFDKT